MKKTSKIGMTAILMAVTGYGAWSLYKKYNPECMNDMEDMFRKMSKDVEKSLDDVM